MNIYQRATTKGCQYETNCTAISIWEWERLMKGHRPANRLKVLKVALLSNVIDLEQYKNERKKPYFNPYNHFITKTHVIYVNSAIEHFIKRNQ